MKYLNQNKGYFMLVNQVIKMQELNLNTVNSDKINYKNKKNVKKRTIIIIRPPVGRIVFLI